MHIIVGFIMKIVPRAVIHDKKDACGAQNIIIVPWNYAVIQQLRFSGHDREKMGTEIGAMAD